jgi:hypothetical protein
MVSASQSTHASNRSRFRWRKLGRSGCGLRRLAAIYELD